MRHMQEVILGTERALLPPREKTRICPQEIHHIQQVACAGSPPPPPPLSSSPAFTFYNNHKDVQYCCRLDFQSYFEFSPSSPEFAREFVLYKLKVLPPPRPSRPSGIPPRIRALHLIDASISYDISYLILIQMKVVARRGRRYFYHTNLVIFFF